MTPPSDPMNEYRYELADITTKYKKLQEKCEKFATENEDLQHHLAVSSQKLENITNVKNVSASAESKLVDQIKELQKDLDESNNRFLHVTSTKEELEKMLKKSTEQLGTLTENLKDREEQLKSAMQTSKK